MKFLTHIVDNLGLGGAQSMLFELYHAINKHFPHLRQDVMTLQNRRTDVDFVSSYKVPYSTYKDPRLMRRTILKYKRPVIIYHKLASSRIDIIEKVNERADIPTIVVNHTFFHTRDWDRVNPGKVNVMVAVSNHMRKHIQEWHPRLKNYRIYNGVDASRYDIISPLPRKEKERLVTGRINRICWWKYSEKWVRFCSDVQLPVPMLHEYMGGGYAQKQINLSKRRGRNVVNFLGSITDFEKKVARLKSWDLFLYETNRNEGISMSILESLASGIPVICSNHLGNIEIIEKGVNGYVFKDYKQARKILTRLSSNKEEIKELKKTTKAHFDKYLDAKNTASEYVKLAEEIYYKRENIVISQQDKANKEEEQKEEKIRKEREEAKMKELEDYSKFTILTAGFNKGPYLQEWADSLISQTQKPSEVVFVNDCSSDNTRVILKSLEKGFHRANIEFKVIHNESHLFCGSSYRVAMKNATGPYYGVVDADDMLVRDAIEYVMGLYKKHQDIAWIYTQFQICNVRMQKLKKGYSRPPGPGECLLDTGEKRKHTYSHWRTCSKRHPRLDKIFPKRLRSAVDKFMGYRLEEFAPGMFVDRICYLYRERVKRSISGVEKTKEDWRAVVKEAKKRRKKYRLSPHPIKILQ